MSSDVDENELRRRWESAWRGVGVNSDSRTLFLDLIARYSEPYRAYHDLYHITECLSVIEMANHLLERPHEAILAVWFHDAVYDPRRSDNEVRSAQLAEAALIAAGATGETSRRIGDLILLTTHDRDNLSGDGAILCDADLAILGASPQRFAQYEADIRREYGWVPEVVYRRERGRVLRRFLSRPFIYHTSFFQERLEQAARLNLTRAMEVYQISIPSE